jgi:hypothetical protein
MIPYSSISQVRYKINGDTIIAFTPHQTRKLAIKLKEGETYKKLYFTNEEILKYKDSIICSQHYTLRICDSLLVVHNNKLDLYNDRIVSYEEDIKQERKKKRQWVWTAVGSIVLNALLIVGIVSK